jgi:hypothetical protein
LVKLLFGFCLAAFDNAKIMLVANNRRLREAKSPAYSKAKARTNLLTIGPTVCPISIVVARNPIEEPTKPEGASSHIRGEVDEITIAKPKPLAYCNKQ